jgi:hypothetical protein
MTSTRHSRELPATAAGGQLAWYLGRLRDGGQAASDEDRERFVWTPGKGRWMPGGQDVGEAWRRLGAGVGKFTVTEAAERGDCEVVAMIVNEAGKRWRLVFSVEEEEPHRISDITWERQFDFEVTVREATEADAPVLAEIERRCPIVLDDRTITFDRGDDYFAFARLMEEVTVGLGFVDGVAAAINCGAMRTVLVGGKATPMMTAIHTRVLPEHQKKGLWGAVSRILGEKYQLGAIGSQGFVSVSNAAMQRGFANTPNKWPVQALRCQLSCEKLAGPPVGRVAGPQDAARIVELLNGCHEGEELYLPYTAETLAARMARAPEQYSWERLSITNGAVVGVWPAGESIQVIVERGGEQAVSRRGLVLDYGFGDGAEGELEALLRAWCGWLAERGFDTLSVFTSERSPGYEKLHGLAAEVDAFDMWTPGIAVPSGAEERGLYVDQIYF